MLVFIWAAGLLAMPMQWQWLWLRVRAQAALKSPALCAHVLLAVLALMWVNLAACRAWAATSLRGAFHLFDAVCAGAAGRAGAGVGEPGCLPYLGSRICS